MNIVLVVELVFVVDDVVLLVLVVVVVDVVVLDVVVVVVVDVDVVVDGKQSANVTSPRRHEVMPLASKPLLHELMHEAPEGRTKGQSLPATEPI